MSIPSRLDCYLEAFRGESLVGGGVVRNVSNVVTTTQQTVSHTPTIVNPSIVGARPPSIIPRPTTAIRSHTTNTVVAPTVSTTITPPPVVSPVISSIPPRVSLPVQTTNTLNVSNVINQRPLSSVRPLPVDVPSRSLPIVNGRPPTFGSVSHNIISPSPVHVEARSSHLNIGSARHSYPSPNITRNIAQPLFSKVSPARQASIAKPATAIPSSIVPTRQSTIIRQPASIVASPTIVQNTVQQNVKSTGLHHLFNRKTTGISSIPSTPSNINFNSAYIGSKLT